jgi:hypothetical protein
MMLNQYKFRGVSFGWLADGRVKYNGGDDKMSYSRTRYTTRGSGSGRWCKSGSLKEIHTDGIHLKPAESSLKACGLGGKNSEAFGSEEKKESIC